MEIHRGFNGAERVLACKEMKPFLGQQKCSLASEEAIARNESSKHVGPKTLKFHPGVIIWNKMMSKLNLKWIGLKAVIPSILEIRQVIVWSWLRLVFGANLDKLEIQENGVDGKFIRI